MGYDLTPDEARWDTPEHPAPGALALSEVLEELHPTLMNREGPYGIYNRKLTASGGKSVHGDGRAMDVGIGFSASAEQATLLHVTTRQLADNAPLLGVQRIIYDHHTWNHRRGWFFSGDSNGGPHVDHAHVELTNEAAWVDPLRREDALAILMGDGSTRQPFDDVEEEVRYKLFRLANHNNVLAVGPGLPFNPGSPQVAQELVDKGLVADRTGKAVAPATAYIDVTIEVSFDLWELMKGGAYDPFGNVPIGGGDV